MRKKEGSRIRNLNLETMKNNENNNNNHQHRENKKQMPNYFYYYLNGCKVRGDEAVGREWGGKENKRVNNQEKNFVFHL